MADRAPVQETEEEQLIIFTERARKGEFAPIREIDILYVRQKEFSGYSDDDSYIYSIS